TELLYERRAVQQDVNGIVQGQEAALNREPVEDSINGHLPGGFTVPPLLQVTDQGTAEHMAKGSSRTVTDRRRPVSVRQIAREFGDGLDGGLCCRLRQPLIERNHRTSCSRCYPPEWFPHRSHVSWLVTTAARRAPSG